MTGKGKFAEYPPNGLQFKLLCMAFYEDLGLPKAIDAYREINNSIYKNRPHWSHELIEFIAKRLPDNFFLIEQEYVAYGLFKKIFEEVCDLVKQGHELSEPREQFKAKRISNPAIASTHLHQMKQHLGV